MDASYTKRKLRHENPRIRKLLLFIHEFKEVNDYSPNMREMGGATDISSTSVVTFYLIRMQARELIDFNRKEARTVRLTKQGKTLVADWLKVEKPESLLRRVTDVVLETS